MSERRHDDRRSLQTEEDRRKIPRFTDTELNHSLVQIKIWIRVLYVLSIIISLTEFGWALSKGIEKITQGIFFGFTFIILAIILWRAMYLIKTFLGNHSINNLKRVHEQLYLVFAYISVVGVIFYLVTIISRF
ncbi:MAG: hypothetical protein KDD58_03375 [Bdellovibrionales bacterium]|nr:hypothetical protein [Bdellovibrionales bacterium]